jgi:Domain of unknown function (DUF4160)
MVLLGMVGVIVEVGFLGCTLLMALSYYLYFMPTVLVVNGFRFFFYSADGDEPAHVHVQKGSGDGKIWLKPETKIEYLVDFKSQEEKQILEIVGENRELLILKWNEYFRK